MVYWAPVCHKDPELDPVTISRTPDHGCDATVRDWGSHLDLTELLTDTRELDKDRDGTVPSMCPWKMALFTERTRHSARDPWGPGFGWAKDTRKTRDWTWQRLGTEFHWEFLGAGPDGTMKFLSIGDRKIVIDQKWEPSQNPFPALSLLNRNLKTMQRRTELPVTLFLNTLLLFCAC